MISIKSQLQVGLQSQKTTFLLAYRERTQLIPNQNMIHNNLVKQRMRLNRGRSSATAMLIGDAKCLSLRSMALVHTFNKSHPYGNLLIPRHLHISQHDHTPFKSMCTKVKSAMSTMAKPIANYNEYETIRQLSKMNIPSNKFPAQSSKPTFISQQYPTISLELQAKLQKIEQIYHSQEKDLYKIVEETIIVLEAFSQLNRREILEENVVKVVREFGGKLVAAYIEGVQTQEMERMERKSDEPKTGDEMGEQSDARYSLHEENDARYSLHEENDARYSLHENYATPPLQPVQKQFIPIATPSSIDLHFILYYIQTVKSWLLSKLQSDSLIRQAEQQLFAVFTARQVSALNDTLKGAVQNLIANYIEEPSAKKREQFAFELKLRGLSLLPFFQNKQHIEQYLVRLSQENLAIYLKESQLVSVMHDITELQPVLSHCTDFIYQLQSTKIYQYLTSINTAYIKARFIDYSRKYMVAYQEIQFYEVFKQIEPRVKSLTVRTLIRLVKILNVESSDLHCEYNKSMGKYNYNILISVAISQNYNPDNTKLDELLELFDALNATEQCGETLYEELAKYLKAHLARNPLLKPEDLSKLYRLFLHLLSQAKPIFKYEDREALNREHGRKTTLLLTVLFDTLLDKYPQVVVSGMKFVKNYLLCDEGHSSTVATLPHDDREIKLEVEGSAAVKEKIEKLKRAYEKVSQQAQMLTIYNLQSYLKSLNHFSQIRLQWIQPLATDQQQAQKQQQPPKQQPPAAKQQPPAAKQQPATAKLASDYTLLGNIYPLLAETSLELSLIKRNLEPIFKQYLQLANKDQIKKLPTQLFRQLYKNLQLCIQAVNTLECKKQTVEMIEAYLPQLRRKVLYEMKLSLDSHQKHLLTQQTHHLHTLQLTVPNGSIELLLTLHQLIKLSHKLHQFQLPSNQPQYLSNTQPQYLSELTLSLPLVYNFVNRLAIKNLKGIEEPDLINMLLFLKNLEEIKTAQKQKVLLLEITPLVWEYLYQSMSMYLMYTWDKAKTYLKLTNQNTQQFIQVISHFVANKAIFTALPSKKRLVPLQLIMVGLIRRKHIKLYGGHMKRSQSVKIFLAFLQIFQLPQNLTVDFKKILEETEFTNEDLEQVSTDILERFSDSNWTISRYLDESNSSFLTTKKLSKMSADQLRKQFETSKTEKLYELILKSSKFTVPFTLPQPQKDNNNAKIVYILQKIYQKISKKNNYGVSKPKSKRTNKNNPDYDSFAEIDSLEDGEGSGLRKNYGQQVDAEGNSAGGQFVPIKLEEYKAYIKDQKLVEYSYQNHYKLNNTRLPVHFKKQNWKNLVTLSANLQIQSLEIDQKIDQTIYKNLLLALLGFVQKVKLITKQFHAHSFVQYIAAQLDMEVFFHGCIARISRKSKPNDNVLIVCAVETNYKLLYICTHILREAGDNAYIIMDKTRDGDFKEFLEKLLPQPFEAEESEIVDKVVKGEIVLEAEDSILKESI